MGRAHATMLPIDPQFAVEALKDFQSAVRERVVQSRGRAGGSGVARDSAADTIYQIDTEVDPLLEAFCREWSVSTPLVLIAEGIDGDDGREGIKVFPEGSREEDALIRVLVDPIDGTRGLMYDKRSAWTLAGVAPNKGPPTRLRDIEVAVMSELPTSKSGQADVLWAIKGRGAHGRRIDLQSADASPLALEPSTATGIEHGFASVSNFFPGTKVLAAQLMEYLAAHLSGAAGADSRARLRRPIHFNRRAILRIDRRPRPFHRRSAPRILSHSGARRRNVLSSLRLRDLADRRRGRRDSHRRRRGSARWANGRDERNVLDRLCQHRIATCDLAVDTSISGPIAFVMITQIKFSPRSEETVHSSERLNCRQIEICRMSCLGQSGAL